ncbi:MAG: hypothetical protein Q8L39_04645 [Burkholderiales bacterium]|nr:hypothetical protein [Burkholderiales bacterium]
MNWLDLLNKAVAEHPRGRAGVAEALDVSRTTISLVLDDKYPAKTDKIEAKVMDMYARVPCPHLNETISINACRAHALRAAPTNSPREMRHWRACQTCACKPEEKRHAA